MKVRAGLNIARTSSSVDLTAGLRRDELGWLPPRLTFDADGLSAGEAAAIDHRHRMSAWDSRKPSQFITPQTSREVYCPAGTVRTMYVHCTYSWYNVRNVRTLYVQCPLGEEEVRAIFYRPARTFTSNFTRTRYFACASYLTSRHSANSLSIVMKVDTLISGGSCSWGCRRGA